jgi:hypothetical protein
MKTSVNITLREDAIPFAQAVPRRIAAARRGPLKKELDRMESLGVIQKIKAPTKWCAPCIVVPKKNQAVLREYYPLPTTEETLSALGSAKIFSQLDANSGYWQLRLSEQAQKLTTFITPFGRYFCRRLPFGISSAPEIFQREMLKVLEGLEGVICQMDDILICGETQEEHDARLEAVIQRLSTAGITLNPDKCVFSKPEVKFLGHIINNEGIHVDPEKTKAITEFAAPKNRKELRRFFGIVNYIGKFTATLAEDTSALRQLLQKDREWIWNAEQQSQFEELKRKLARAPTLTPYQLEAETLLSTDASSYGLGAAILQKVEGSWKPVAFASRSMNPAETRYAQIEKEALAICWGCEKFHYYLAGRKFRIETDHKPLISVLGDKELARLPIRVQRFRLRMMAYTYSISYTPGEKLVLADALSRAPLPGGMDSESTNELVVSEIAESLPISQRRRDRIKAAILADEESTILLQYIREGWPVYVKVNPMVQKYFTFKDFLTEIDGVIYYWDRVYIPRMERDKVLEDIHKGHQGESKCIRRATELVWWPGMTAEIRELVKMCTSCIPFRNVAREPIAQTPLPDRTWWRLAADVCEKDSIQYLVLVDFYSRYIVARRIEDCEAKTIIRQLEDVFCMLGIPHSLVTDNATYFKGEIFQKFLTKWDVVHITSAPHRGQSNGEAERAVQTVKGFLNKNINLQAALCSYRDTPLENGYSPAMLLFGRGLNSMGINNFRSVDVNRFKSKDTAIKSRLATNYNKRFAVRERSPLRLLQQVRVVDGTKRKPQIAIVVGTNGREVLLEKDGSILRRNRAQITKVPDPTTLIVSENRREGQELIPPPSAVQVAVASDNLAGAYASPPVTEAVASERYEHQSPVGTVAPTPVTGALAPEQVAGAVAPLQSKGAVAPLQQVYGAVASPPVTEAVASSSLGASAPEVGRKCKVAIAANQSKVAIATKQSKVAFAANQYAGAIAPIKRSRSNRPIRAPKRYDEEY